MKQTKTMKTNKQKKKEIIGEFHYREDNSSLNLVAPWEGCCGFYSTILAESNTEARIRRKFSPQLKTMKLTTHFARYQTKEHFWQQLQHLHALQQWSVHGFLTVELRSLKASGGELSLAGWIGWSFSTSPFNLGQ